MNSLNHANFSDQVKKNLHSFLQQTAFDPAQEKPQHKTVFRIRLKRVGNLGDAVTFSGLPKAGKTKYISAAIAAAITGMSVFDLTIKLPPGKDKVVHFDTEQSKPDHYDMMELIKRLSGYADSTMTAFFNAVNFKSFQCRKMKAEHMLSIIEYFLSLPENKNVGIVFLDGLLDVVNNMNDTNYSSHLKQWIKRITEQYEVLLISVIHRTKGADKSAGHVGSEIERVSQSVLMIEKIPKGDGYVMDRYRLKPEYMRSDDFFEPIDIYYNPQLCLWEMMDFVEDLKPQKPTKRTPQEIPEDEHQSNVRHIFSSQPLYSKYDDFVRKIKEVYIAPNTEWARRCAYHLCYNLQLVFDTEDGYTNRQQGKLKLISEQK